jgi:hypothetical protein
MNLIWQNVAQPVLLPPSFVEGFILSLLKGRGATLNGGKHEKNKDVNYSKTNPISFSIVPSGLQHRGDLTGSNWQADL